MVTLWLLVFFGSAAAQSLLPWENIIVPDDPNDEEDRKNLFDCYAQCFNLNPFNTDPSKKALAKVQSHCYSKVSDMAVFKLADTKVYISSRRQLDWFSAYAACRKNSMDLLGQTLATAEEEFSVKLLKYYRDKDSFWLGGTDQPDSKFRWSDTGTDMATTGRAAKLGASQGTQQRCLEARISGSEVIWVGSPCTEAKRFICVLQKQCIR